MPQIAYEPAATPNSEIDSLSGCQNGMRSAYKLNAFTDVVRVHAAAERVAPEQPAVHVRGGMEQQADRPASAKDAAIPVSVPVRRRARTATSLVAKG